VLIISIQVTELPDDTEIVYSFWNAMPLATQIHILELSSSCRNVQKLAVFHDDKWSTPAKGHFLFPFIFLSLASQNMHFTYTVDLRQWFKS
jgi:hypothetical protein